MLRGVLLPLCLALCGCGWFGGPGDEPDVGGSRPAVAMDGTTMHRLLGQDALDKPLLPQPGDIWADVLPHEQPGPAGAAAPNSQSLHRPAPQVASSVRSGLPIAPLVAAEPPTAAIPTTAATSPAAAHPPEAALHPKTAVPLAAGRPPVVLVTAKAAPRPAPHPLVQLTAAHSAQDAEAEWRRLRQRATKLTDGHLPALSEAEVNGQHVWRLRASGFTDTAEASAFCSGIRAVKADCWVVPPPALP